MVIPALLYVSECWVLTRNKESSINAADIKVLRAVSGCTRQNYIRNDIIQEDLGETKSQDARWDGSDTWKEWKKHAFQKCMACKYKSMGKRDVCRLRNGVELCATTGHWSYTFEADDDVKCSFAKLLSLCIVYTTI